MPVLARKSSPLVIFSDDSSLLLSLKHASKLLTLAGVAVTFKFSLPSLFQEASAILICANPSFSSTFLFLHRTANHPRRSQNFVFT